jgi:hypothetical protein
MTDLLEKVNEQLIEIDRCDSGEAVANLSQVPVGPPGWLHRAKVQLADLSRLQDNWDGHESSSVDPEVVKDVGIILDRFPADSVEPWLAATSDGGISVEWSTKNTVLLLKVEPDEPPTLYIEIRGRTWEGPLDDAPDALDELARDWITPQ